MNVLLDPPTTPQPIRLRVSDYVLLNDSGAFEGYAKTELLDGEIVCMNAQRSRHARIKTRLTTQLAQWAAASGAGLEALSEVSVQLSDTSMPEPDVALTSYSGDGYVPVESVRLIIEIADTTLAFDLGRKAALYAAAGVPEYWVVDLEGARVARMSEPHGGSYDRFDEIPLGDKVDSVTIIGLSVSTERQAVSTQGT